MFSTKIIRNRDGAVVYSAVKSLSAGIAWCEGEAQPTGVDQAFVEIANQAAEQVRREISPYTENYSVRLLETTQGMSKKSIATFKRLVKFSTRDISNSCNGWAKLLETEKSSGSLLFNLGVCAEVGQDYDLAIARYRAAHEIFPKGKAEALASLTRSEQAKLALAQVRDQIAERKKAELRPAAKATPRRKRK